MLNGIGWSDFIKTIVLVVAGYYVVIGWIYRKQLLQWWRERKKRE
ncbi:MAG: hypothetical protein V4539_01330 [Bacteroidota bacterium]